MPELLNTRPPSAASQCAPAGGRGTKHACTHTRKYHICDVLSSSPAASQRVHVQVLEMDPATKAIFPTSYEGVSVVSFGFAGQGSAIMRGPMVSGLIQQMLTTAQWGEAAGWVGLGSESRS